jgi:hypothetical protein
MEGHQLRAASHAWSARFGVPRSRVHAHVYVRARAACRSPSACRTSSPRQAPRRPTCCGAWRHELECFACTSPCPVPTRSTLLLPTPLSANRPVPTRHHAFDILLHLACVGARSKLLVFNPHKRLSADEALRHPYVAQVRAVQCIREVSKKGIVGEG